ncbi:MAG: hypothetical protein LC624_02325 [Halobacteriales archaeon]|nr:hypothetical protein [Halobacteriales archaeon]
MAALMVAGQGLALADLGGGVGAFAQGTVSDGLAYAQGLTTDFASKAGMARAFVTTLGANLQEQAVAASELANGALDGEAAAVQDTADAEVLALGDGAPSCDVSLLPVFGGTQAGIVMLCSGAESDLGL